MSTPYDRYADEADQTDQFSKPEAPAEGPGLPMCSACDAEIEPGQTLCLDCMEDENALPPAGFAVTDCEDGIDEKAWEAAVVCGCENCGKPAPLKRVYGLDVCKDCEPQAERWRRSYEAGLKVGMTGSEIQHPAIGEGAAEHYADRVAATRCAVAGSYVTRDTAIGEGLRFDLAPTAYAVGGRWGCHSCGTTFSKAGGNFREYPCEHCGRTMGPYFHETAGEKRRREVAAPFLKKM